MNKEIESFVSTLVSLSLLFLTPVIFLFFTYVCLIFNTWKEVCTKEHKMPLN
jgi:hypothetical protein